MRYHKAITVTKVEAEFIIGTRTTALSEFVVISRGDRYYDVRAMNEAEIRAFVADLARAEYAEMEAQTARPC